MIIKCYYNPCSASVSKLYDLEMLLEVILLLITLKIITFIMTIKLNFHPITSSAPYCTTIWNLSPFSRSNFVFKMPVLHSLLTPEWLRWTRFQQRAHSQEVDIHYGFCITIISLNWFSIFISINPHSCSTMISSWLEKISCCLAFFCFLWVGPWFCLNIACNRCFQFKFLCIKYYTISDWSLDWFPCFVPYVCGVLDPSNSGHHQAHLKEEEKSSWGEAKPSWAFPSRALSVGGDPIVTAL